MVIFGPDCDSDADLDADSDRDLLSRSQIHNATFCCLKMPDANLNAGISAGTRVYDRGFVPVLVFVVVVVAFDCSEPASNRTKTKTKTPIPCFCLPFEFHFHFQQRVSPVSRIRSRIHFLSTLLFYRHFQSTSPIVPSVKSHTTIRAASIRALESKWSRT